MVQPLRADEKSLDRPVSFRVTKGEREDIDRCVELLGLAPKDGGDYGPKRGEVLRLMAHEVAHGALMVSGMTDEDRAKLDRLVAAQGTLLARLGVHAVRPTPSSVILSMLRESPEPEATSPDVKAFVAAATVHEAAVREAAAREAAARAPAAPPTPEPEAAVREAAARAPAAPPTPEPEAADVDVEAIREALDAATKAGETAATVAGAVGLSPSAIRSFKSTGKGIGAQRRNALAAYLREKGHLKGS